jgi:hypothetical protein
MTMKSQILILFLLAIGNANAQTFDEWFQQKKTQKKYLGDQIVALKVYAGYAKKGYSIVHGGLTTIENIKNGNFVHDQSFFDSKRNVNPALSNSIKVANILGYQAMIIRDFRRLYQSSRMDPGFTADEILYLGHVYANMLRQCDASLDDLMDVIQSGSLEMTDDERLKRIDALHADMADKYAFTQAFGNETRLLAAQRSAEKAGIISVRNLHDNN